MKISGRKSILSETNKVTNIKQKSGKHEVYTDLDIYDENGKLKTELLPTVSIGANIDDYALSGHTHPNATISAHGFMSSTDKSKLNGIEVGAEVNNLSDADASELQGILGLTDIHLTGLLRYDDLTDTWELDTNSYASSSHSHDLSSLSGDLDDIADGSYYVRSKNNFTDTLLSKLNGIEIGAEVNNISDSNVALIDELFTIAGGVNSGFLTFNYIYGDWKLDTNSYLKKSADANLDMNNYHIQEAKTVTASAEYDNGNSGTAKTITWTNGQFQKLTLTGNCTITFASMSGYAYPTRYQLKLIQDTTGNRTVTWPSGIRWADKTEPTLSTAASAEDIVTVYFDGSNYYATAGLNFGTVS
jgi:hypothetical protein